MNTPAQAELERLLEGNQNFKNGICSCHKRSLATLQKFAHKQEPKAIILGCSDSRFIPNIIFDCGLGELFVVRTAGATAGVSSDILESLEFAVVNLKCPLMMIIGHDNCGAVSAAKEDFLAKKETYCSVVSSIMPVLEEHHELETDEITKKHTKNLCKTIVERSEIIAKAVEQDELAVVAGHLSFSTGQVEIL